MLATRKVRVAPPLRLKHKRRTAIEEITFDPQARQEYLTGFHKRKVQRQKQAQEIAAQKEKEERRIHRAQLRAEREANLQKHLAATNGEFNLNTEDADTDGGETTPDDGASGLPSSPIPLDREVEFDDEDRTATVTVEAVDVTRDGLQNREQRQNADAINSGARRQRQQAQGTTKARPNAKPKRRKKKFRYESKAERQINRVKEQAAGKAKAQARRQQAL